MSLGTIQTVLVCQTSTIVDSFGVCPTGQSLTTVQAYILDSSSQALFENSALTDFSIPAEYFGFAITVILTAWLASKGFGFLFRALR